MVAGTASGCGKTTVATGLMAALRLAGRRVSGAKVGPDFIDPGYHQVATRRPSRNLDAFLSGPDAIPSLAARAAAGTDLLIVEGVMGLFDGTGASYEASTAHVAQLMYAPVVLVVDASALSGSVTALVHGYDDWLRSHRGAGLAAVVLNRVGSATHESLLREALSVLGMPVLGALARGAVPAWRDRHLGLVPVIEQQAAVTRSVEQLGKIVAEALDLEAIEALAHSAPPLEPAPLPPVMRVVGRGAAVRVAVAQGPAFSFAYPDNLEALEQAGAELCPFDPIEDTRLPEAVAGLYAGGGFPEMFAGALSANHRLRDDVGRRIRAGLVTWAECGGQLWLSESVEGHPQCGVLPARGRMTDRVVVGYRTALAHSPNPVLTASATHGHEHHYSVMEPAGDALELTGVAGHTREGWAGPSILSTYLHLHLGADPVPAERFVATAARLGLAPRNMGATGGPGGVADAADAPGGAAEPGHYAEPAVRPVNAGPPAGDGHD